MRVLLSTIGSRGEAQPVLALAAQLNAMGHEAHVCAPPDFQALAQEIGVRYTSVGSELKGTAKHTAATPPTPEQRRQMIEGTIVDQFAAVLAAGDGSDVIVGGGALAIAAHSVAEHLRARYVYAAFAPITLPSGHHAPPVFGVLGQKVTDRPTDNRVLWDQDRQRWNVMWSRPLNDQRARLGLAPVADVRDHLFTTGPWLAADPILAPWPDDKDLGVFQTGAWILPDHRPLAQETEDFLQAGDPPIYFGFGSMRAPAGLATAILEASRSLGHRAVVARGWAGVTILDNDGDRLIVDEVNQQKLFRRCAAVVHHGGAGTTTAAAQAGVPQVICPRMFDQFYFASRVSQLEIGTAHSPQDPTSDSLADSLRLVLADDVLAAAKSMASRVHGDGTAIAARRLTEDA